MATRFYLPISGTPPLSSLAVNTNWELTDNLVRLPCFTTKQDTALTNYNYTWPASTTQQWCWRQWQSAPLGAAYSWTTSDTVSMVIGKCAETSNGGDTHLAYVVRVVSGDGTTVRGVIGLYHATSSEFPLTASAATRIHSARTDGAAAFSSQIGDRIIIEIGLHGVTPAAESIQMRFGDPSGTSDFALTAGLTTDLCPWVELSRTVSFGTTTSDSQAAYTKGSTSGTSSKSAFTQGPYDIDPAITKVSLQIAHIETSGTPASDNQNAYTKGSSTSSTVIHAFTKGQSISSDNQAAYTKGAIGVLDNQLAYTKGQSSTSANKAAYTKGAINVLSNKNAYTEGQASLFDSQTAYTKGQSLTSDNQLAFTKGAASSLDSQSAYTKGQSLIVDNQSAYTNGQAESITSKHAYVSGISGALDNQPAYTKGQSIAFDNQAAFVQGQLGIADSLYAYVKGQSTAIDNQLAYVAGISTLTSYKEAFVQGQISTNSLLHAYTEGFPAEQEANTSIHAYVKGQITVIDNNPAYTKGQSIASDSQSAFVEGIPIATSTSKTAFVQGQISINSLLYAYTEGASAEQTASDSQFAYTKGQSLAVYSQLAYVKGQNIASDNQLAYVNGKDISLDNQPAFTKGQATSLDSQSAYTSGINSILDSQHAFTQGSDLASDFISVYTEGTGQYLIPDSDIITGSWQNELGGSGLYASVADNSDSTYDWYDTAISGAYFEVGLSNPGTIIDGVHYFIWRAYRKSGTTTVTLKCEVRQGSGIIVTSDTQTLLDTVTEYHKTLTPDEVSNITDFNDLRMRITIVGIE